MHAIDIHSVDHNLIRDMGGEDGFLAYETVLPGATVNNQALQIVYHPQHGRGGIVQVGSGANGMTFWTDATSADDVLQRYLVDELLN